jgi:hypothetical protein
VNATAQIACGHWKELERTSPSRSERAGVDSPSAFWFSPPPLVSVCVCLCRSSQLLLPVPSDCCPEGRGPREAGRNNVDETTQTDTDGKKRRGTFYEEHHARPGIDAPCPLRSCCIDRLRSPYEWDESNRYAALRGESPRPCRFQSSISRFLLSDFRRDQAWIVLIRSVVHCFDSCRQCAPEPLPSRCSDAAPAAAKFAAEPDPPLSNRRVSGS